MNKWCPVKDASPWRTIKVTVTDKCEVKRSKSFHTPYLKHLPFLKDREPARQQRTGKLNLVYGRETWSQCEYWKIGLRSPVTLVRVVHCVLIGFEKGTLKRHLPGRFSPHPLSQPTFYQEFMSASELGGKCTKTCLWEKCWGKAKFHIICIIMKHCIQTNAKLSSQSINTRHIPQVLPLTLIDCRQGTCRSFIRFTASNGNI